MVGRIERENMRRAPVGDVYRVSTKGYENDAHARQVERVIIIELGVEALPASRCDAAFRGNDSGWAAQLQRIEYHVAGTL